MEPIVSPWIIYGISVLDSFKSGGFMLFVIPFWVYGLYWLIRGSLAYDRVSRYRDDEENRSKIVEARTLVLRGLKKMVIGFVIIGTMLFVPSKETVIGMIVAQNITPDNIKATAGVLKDAKNELKADVIQLIQAFRDSSK